MKQLIFLIAPFETVYPEPGFLISGISSLDERLTHRSDESEGGCRIWDSKQTLRNLSVYPPKPIFHLFDLEKLFRAKETLFLIEKQDFQGKIFIVNTVNIS